MGKIPVNGTEIYFEKKGKGPPLFLVCGFTNHLGMWEKLVPFLSKHFEVICFDHRGSGRSGVTPPPYTIDGLTDDIVMLMKGLNISRAYFAGFSMGSAILQSLALRHPEKMEKGVLISPFNTLPSTALMQAHSVSKLFQAGVDPALALETILPWIFSNRYLSEPDNVTKTIERLLRDPYPQPPEGYAGQLAAISSFDLTNKLEEIETKLLLLAGEKDLYTPLYTVDILEKRMANATLKTYPEMGHMLTAEMPETVAEEIYAFCKN
ncbi:MAG: alpha/beta fold hydrolase [Chlamydiia bacterium]|nr:alpha/beta fold hydrolase [Chlamydiia bacterium]